MVMATIYTSANRVVGYEYLVANSISPFSITITDTGYYDDPGKNRDTGDHLKEYVALNNSSIPQS